MTLRTTRARKVQTTRIGEHILKMRLFPWLRTEDGYVWLASMAISKSQRQLNDWTTLKKNKRAKKLKASLTGRAGFKTQAIAIRQVRDWMKEIPVGDSISLRCESCVPEKQYKIWKKWFIKNESTEWEISDKYKSFFFYRSE